MVSLESIIDRSKEVVIEGNVGAGLLIVHNVPEAVDRLFQGDPIDVILVPLAIILAHCLEILMALREIIAGNVGVEMMDVVEFNSVSEQSK